MSEEIIRYDCRSDIPVGFTWDLSKIFESDSEFESELKKAESFPDSIAEFEGRISESPCTLLKFLELDDEMSLVIGKLANYASRKSDEDTRDSRYQSYESQVMSLCVRISSASAWFTPELLSMDDQKLEEFYRLEPRLELYRKAIDRTLRDRPHTLSPAEERLLAQVADVARQPSNIYSLFSDADLSFDDAMDSEGELHPVTHGSYITLMMSPDRTLRESAFKSLYAKYDQFKNTCAATLNAQAKQLKLFADARHFDSALERSLFNNEVPVEVYENLIESVHTNMPAMYKYVSLRKKLLGVNELHFYDLYTPVTSDLEMQFTYEEACEMICKALEPMGDEYLSMVKHGLENRWVDVYETPGKRSGAYSAGGYGMEPYILMNFQCALDDVFTLIHEMGHSMHTYLSCTNQPIAYSDYVIFVAEVASTCNEALLTRYLLDNSKDDSERAYILNHFLEQFRGTLYRQCMFAEFELEVGRILERGEAITADALCELYGNLNRLYFGDDIVLDEEIKLEWARIPHFYYNYYVYQYSTGFAAAIALSQRILSRDEGALNDYLEFLKSGSSSDPISLLRGAGVDMSSCDPIDSALEYFDKLVDEFADLVQRLG